MHREVTHNKFPASFSHFVEAIFDFFRRRMPQEWTKWRDTVTDNFRIISHKDFLGFWSEVGIYTLSYWKPEKALAIGSWIGSSLAMLRGGFLSAKERTALKAVMRHPSETHGVARRANAILLLDDGWNCAKVAEALYLDDDTVRTWFKRYQAGGLDEMKVFDWKGRSGDLSRERMAELSARLGERLMRDSGEVAAYIAARWGVVYGPSGCVALLHRLGWASNTSARKACRPARMRPGRPPSSRDTTNCSTGWPPTRSSTSPMPCTRSTSPAPRMAGSARATRWRCGGHRGASASTSTRRSTWRISTALWSRPSGSMPPPPSRYSRSWRPATPGKRRIYVIADNARYHHARVVRQWLERPDCRITLVFLPAYAPHLNAIERLWAVMHREVTHNRFYPNFGHFVDAIFDFFRRRMPQEWKNGATPSQTTSGS